MGVCPSLHRLMVWLRKATSCVLAEGHGVAGQLTTALEVSGRPQVGDECRSSALDFKQM